MPMSQDDIRRHYESSWKQASDAAKDQTGLAYSSPVEDAVVFPLYRQLLADLKINATGGSILDIGSGSGRWIRFFLDQVAPAVLMGVDFTQASVDLLQRWHAATPAAEVIFRQADITQSGLDLGRRFDLINVANVLFHIPEPDRHSQALANLCRHLAPGGRLITTEYLPRISMRTEWMLVRGRYEFERAVDAAGLRIVDIRASAFFANDPMGIDGPDEKTRRNFNQVRAMTDAIFNSNLDANSKQFFVNFLAEIERACLAFSAERISAIEMPSQKLVVLAAK